MEILRRYCGKVIFRHYRGDSGTLGGACSAGDEGTESEHHGQTLANGTDQEELAATDTLNSEP